MNQPATAPACCRHCGQAMPADRDDGFCCGGCHQVYHLLHEWGLDSFYQMRADGGVINPEALRPANDQTANDETFSGPAFEQAFIRANADGSHEIDWHVDGVHCAACVWLLEALPRLDAGILNTRLDFGSGRLRIRYRADTCPPARQARLITQLGYRPHPWGERSADDSLRRELRRWLLRFVIAGASAVSAMHLAFALFAGHHHGDMDANTVRTLGLVVWMVALPAILYGAWPFYRAALAALRLRRPVLEHSVVLVVIGAVVLGAWNLVQAKPEIYVDALAMFIAFLLGGRVALIAARQRVAREHGLHGLLPTEATRIDSDNNPHRVMADDLSIGDIIEVGDQQVIAADGDVISGSATVDVAVLTGEPRPIQVTTGNTVAAGTRVLGGTLRLRCSATHTESRMGRLLSAVREGHWRATPRAERIDRLQIWYVPALLLLAAGTAGLWWHLDATRALDQTMALVLACCPCALGMATPLTYALAVRRAARRGWLINDGGAIESLAAPRHIVLDKTGTCTAGRISLTSMRWLDTAPTDESMRKRILGALRTAESRSAHPIALATVVWCEANHISTTPISDWQEHTGCGISCCCADGELRIGKTSWLGLSDSSHSNDSGFGISLNGTAIAHATVSDQIIENLSDIIANLATSGANIHLLSGDHQAATNALASQAGIDLANAHGDCNPEDKATRVTALRADGPTVMIGDGINDRLALDAADVGIGVRGGLEAATACCQVYLAEHGLGAVPTLIHHAQRAVNTLRHALMWSLFYNFIAVTAVVAGAWGPYVCAVAMPVSSLLTILLVTRSSAFRMRNHLAAQHRPDMLAV